MKLPTPINAFFEAFNAHDAGAVVARFTNDGIVEDEGRNYRGSAIRKWIDRVNAAYQPQAKPSKLNVAGNEHIVAAEISGTFPGSPIQLRYFFTLKKDKISKLVCSA